MPPDQAQAAGRPQYLQVAVFRLLDTCAVLQEDMVGYLHTAALEKIAGIENVFRWFQKRDVKVCLLSELNRKDTETVLARLGWEVDGEKDASRLVDLVLLMQPEEENPIRRLLELLGNVNPRHIITVGDTPTMLKWSWSVNALFNVGVTYGSHSYRDLAPLPHHALLDNPLNLPNFILENLITETPTRAERAPMARRPSALRLLLPFRFSLP